MKRGDTPHIRPRGEEKLELQRKKDGVTTRHITIYDNNAVKSLLPGGTELSYTRVIAQIEKGKVP